MTAHSSNRGMLTLLGISLAVFMVLPILAWGDTVDFLRHPARLGADVLIVLSSVAVLFTGANLGGVISSHPSAPGGYRPRDRDHAPLRGASTVRRCPRARHARRRPRPLSRSGRLDPRLCPSDRPHVRLTRSFPAAVARARRSLPRDHRILSPPPQSQLPGRVPGLDGLVPGLPLRHRLRADRALDSPGNQNDPQGRGDARTRIRRGYLAYKRRTCALIPFIN